MREFLKAENLFLENHKGFIVNLQNLLVCVEISGQILPNLQSGLQMAIFLRSHETQDSVLIVNKSS